MGEGGCLRMPTRRQQEISSPSRRNLPSPIFFLLKSSRPLQQVDTIPAWFRSNWKPETGNEHSPFARYEHTFTVFPSHQCGPILTELIVTYF